MRIIQMDIGNEIKRIDNHEVRKCPSGYYIKKDVSLWGDTFKKQYLTDEEVANYLEIIEHNERVDIKNKKIKEAIQAGRVKRVNQFIGNNSMNGSGVMHNIYYDSQGEII